MSMKAVTWQGKRDVRVDTVPDPKIEQPTDAIIRVTTTNLCGSDLHLYEPLGAFMGVGDILGHEPMGIVEEVGSEVGDLKVGDRVVIPFQMSCGHCYMCDAKLFSQCETTQVRDQGMGAALFGFSKLYGEVPGGQAEYLRVPQAQTTHIKVPDGPADERFVYLSDVLPTAWQSVVYADVPKGGTLAVLGLGPIGDMAARIAQHQGARVIAVDLVPERLHRARARGIEVLDLREHGKDLGDVIRDMTEGRGTDAVIDAVGMEAHGSPVNKLLQQAVGLLPDAGPTDSTRCTPRSTSSAGAEPYPSSGFTVVPPIPSRCSSYSISRFSCAWVRRTCCAGFPTSCRCSPTATRWASILSRPTRCRWPRRRTLTRCSRRRRTAP